MIPPSSSFRLFSPPFVQLQVFFSSSQFALETVFGPQARNTRASINTVEQQVVAGMKYKINVNVYQDSTQSCQVHEFVVYDRFGKSSLVGHDILKSC